MPDMKRKALQLTNPLGQRESKYETRLPGQMFIQGRLTPSAAGDYYYSAGKAPSLFWVGTTKVRFLGIWVSVWVGLSVADLRQLQVVLPTKNLTLTLLPVSPRPIFRSFCSDTIGILWRYRAEREWTPMASYRAEWVKGLIRWTSKAMKNQNRSHSCGLTSISGHVFSKLQNILLMIR